MAPFHWTSAWVPQQKPRGSSAALCIWFQEVCISLLLGDEDMVKLHIDFSAFLEKENQVRVTIA